VKVLFVGEGQHDIGKATFSPNQPRPAGGVMPVLAGKLAQISENSLAISFREIPLFDRERRGSGLAKKVEAAILLSQRFECAGTICVSDRDGKEGRLEQLAQGKVAGQSLLNQPHPVACGLAVESIEAWTLGDPRAIADVLGLEPAEVEAKCRTGKHLEELKETSGKPDHRPKSLLQTLAQLKHRDDGEEFRREVAQRADIGRLESACPKGFAPFAAEIRREFGPA
jgi:hypothetical protein